jgi:hypothetical protein
MAGMAISWNSQQPPLIDQALTPQIYNKPGLWLRHRGLWNSDNRIRTSVIELH